MSLSSLLYPGSRVAVVGSRDFPSRSLVECFVIDLPFCVVVSGGARGVDSFAEASAKLARLDFELFKADWARYRRGAGPVRNQKIVDSGLNVLVAFVSNPRRLSPGSADVIRRARSARVPVFVFGPDGCEVTKKGNPIQLSIW
jgi:hypothetical protein